MILDIHSHILPGLDDGAKDYNESLELLSMMKKQGVDVVVATPHLDPSKPTAEQKRERVICAYNELCSRAEGRRLPDIFLGYELVFYYGIAEKPNLADYTIAGTDKILLELPFGRMTDRIVSELEEIAFTRKLTPVLAHLERYTKYEGIEKIYDAIYSGIAQAQVSADTIKGFWDRRNIGKLLKKDIFTYLGSDAHSVNLRPPMMDSFLKFAKKRHQYFYTQMLGANRKLYKDMKKPTA